MSSEFPLFRLPLIVLNHGLKLMTPFEIISLSLCSKRCKTVCQSLRNQLKCKEKAVKFQLKFSKKREIRMEFNYYPNTRWILSIFQISGKDEIGLSRNDLFVNNWIPTEDDTPQEQIRENNSMVNQYLKVYISNDYDIFMLRKYINHLSYIFNITLTDLELHFQDFTREENEIIIDLYCGNRRNTNCVKALTLVGESENTPEDDEVLYHILSRQEAKHELSLDIKPTSKFVFRGNQLRYSINQLIVRNSDWLSCSELSRFDSFAIWIFNSKINPFNIEFMIEEWYSAWTPNWTLAMIQFVFINIDFWMNRIKKGFSDGDLLRSEETIEGPDGLSHRIKYSIRRNDGTIAEFLVENNKYLYIKARGNTDVSLSTFISKTKTMM